MTCGRSVFFPGTSVFSTNKTDRHDITESGVKYNNTITACVTDTLVDLTFIFSTLKTTLLQGYRRVIAGLPQQESKNKPDDEQELYNIINLYSPNGYQPV